MNQLYHLNLRRVLATRYKKSLSFSQAFSLSLPVRMSLCVDARSGYESLLTIFCEQQSNMLSLSRCIISYILFVFVWFFFSRALSLSSILLLSIEFSQSAKTIMYLCMSLCGYVLFLHVLLLLLFLLLAPRSI